jgi:hypothetical protein
MDQKKRLKTLSWFFWAAILISIGLSMSNYGNYLGLLRSMNEIEFNLDEVTHRLDDTKIEFTINFSLMNPTNYKQLKFSSLQCQLYINMDEQEQYLGATGYAPPVDVPLHPDEIRNYTTVLSIQSDALLNPNGVPLSEVHLRVRNVIHFSTPLRRFYQNFNLNEISYLSTD